MGTVSGQSNKATTRIEGGINTADFQDNNVGGGTQQNNQNNEDTLIENNLQMEYSTNELNGAISKYDHQGTDQQAKD